METELLQKPQDWIAAINTDPRRIAQNVERQRAVQRGTAKYLPILVNGPIPPRINEFLPEPVNIFDEFYSHEHTLSNGLRSIASHAYIDDRAPCIRPNLGTGTAATTFGATQTVFKDKMPWVTQHVELEDLANFDAQNTPLGETVELGLQRAKYLQDALKGTGIDASCWDTQSPFDLAHLVIGDDIFYSMYDEPELTKKLLDDCATIIIRHCKAFYEATGINMEQGRNSGAVAMMGGIRLSEDTLTLLNEEQIHEFALPYSNRVLEELGGGMVHYCGRNDFLLNAVLNHMPQCRMLNFGQPDKHDMQQVIRQVCRAGKVYQGNIPREENENAEDYFTRILGYCDNNPQGLILQTNANADEDPVELVRLWRKLQNLTEE